MGQHRPHGCGLGVQASRALDGAIKVFGELVNCQEAGREEGYLHHVDGWQAWLSEALSW